MIKNVEHSSANGITNSTITLTCNDKDIELRLVNISEFNSKNNSAINSSNFEFSIDQSNNLYRLNINDDTFQQVECICEEIKIQDI